MEEFFIGVDLFVSLLKETALEVILFFIVLFSVVSLNPIFFAVALRGVAFIFSRAGAAGNKIIITITNPRITKRDIKVVCRIFCNLDSPVIPHISIRIHR